MRRADRLFDLIQILRDGRLHRAQDMADRLQVSTRTIWRDMATLVQSGLPVEGERGVGYILRAPITLPPMVLTPDEMEALRLGVRLVAGRSDPGLARAARSLAGKIAALLPQEADLSGDDELFAYDPDPDQRATAHLPVIRRAVRGRERLTITYLETNGSQSHRDIRPLQLETSGKVWTLAAWCEARRDFRSLRVDRILALEPTGETFPDEPGRRLADYRARTAPEN
jgi:predicted DNA-binding transcriptional regulator YafY